MFILWSGHGTIINSVSSLCEGRLITLLTKNDCTSGDVNKLKVLKCNWNNKYLNSCFYRR